jgi:hypothetical protein
MPALPRVRMGCTLSTRVIEIGRVSVVRPVAVADRVLLATAGAGCTGAAVPVGTAWGSSDGPNFEVDWALLAATCAGCTGAVVPVGEARGPDGEPDILGPAGLDEGEPGVLGSVGADADTADGPAAQTELREQER